MTNAEYMEEKLTCKYAGDIGSIEAFIRLRCMVKGIDFDDAKIESWLDDIIPIYEKNGMISADQVLKMTIGNEYVCNCDYLHGFARFDPRRAVEHL